MSPMFLRGRCVGGGSDLETRLAHEITIVRGQGRHGAYAEGRSIYVLV